MRLIVPILPDINGPLVVLHGIYQRRPPASPTDEKLPIDTQMCMAGIMLSSSKDPMAVS